MQTEILDYRFTTEWNLESILKDETFHVNLQPKFPLVVTTMSFRESSSNENCRTDYISGKRRGKPSEVLDSFSGSVIARRAGDYLGLSGQNILINANCASTLYALHMATIYSQLNNTPAVVVCADNVNHPYDIWRFSSLGALDNETGRPFDKSSKGFKMGKSVSVFLVKHPSVKFNLAPKATIINYGFYTNNQLLTNPGTSEDIIKNLPNMNYRDIDFWNAHATGTPVGDIVEYDYFNSVIAQDIPIVSYKGHVGHSMSAAGAIELILSLEGKKNNILLPNIIHGEKIVNDDRIITEQTKFPFTKMLKASLGFGGKIAVAEIDLY